MKAIIFPLLLSTFTFSTTIIATPSSDIQSLINSLQGGDVLEFEEGIYREELVVNNQSFLTPITLKAASGAQVIFDGTDSIKNSWTQHQGDVWKQKLSKPIWQLFKNQVQQTPARWPNAQYESNDGFLEMSANYWAHCDNKDYTDTYVADADFPFTEAQVKGAMIVVNNGSWKTYATKVTAVSGGQIQ